MLLLGAKKKIAQAILSEGPKKAKEKEVPNGLEADFSEALESLAGELCAAVQSGDPGMVSRSLKRFIHLCQKEGEYEPGE